jgi:hypothetical protein
MTTEALVARVAGIGAGSLVLVAFGLDSVIELISAGVLMWRLSTELRHGQAFSEAAERLASRIGGVLLFALATYAVLAAAGIFGIGVAKSFPWLDSLAIPSCGGEPCRTSRLGVLVDR